MTAKIAKAAKLAIAMAFLISVVGTLVVHGQRLYVTTNDLEWKNEGTLERGNIRQDIIGLTPRCVGNVVKPK